MSIDRTDDKWKKDFKDKLEGYKYPIRSGMWDDIDGSLPQHKRRSKRILWAWIGSAAAMLTAIIVLAGPYVVNYVRDINSSKTKTEKANAKQKGKLEGDKTKDVYNVEPENEETNEPTESTETIDSIETGKPKDVNIKEERNVKKEKKHRKKYTRTESRDVKTDFSHEQKANDDNDLQITDAQNIYSLNIRDDATSENVLPADTLTELQNPEADEIKGADVEQPKVKKDYSSWSFALSSKNMIYNGYHKQWGESQAPNPPADEDYVVGWKKQFNHPVNINLTVRKQLSNHWAIESGLSYTYLRSEETIINSRTSPTVTDIKIHSLGIPVSVEYMLYRSGGINIYSKYGIMLEKTKGYYNHIKDWQVSTWLSGGISYRLGKNIGVFVEPGGTYYFNNNTSLPTLRNEAKLNFDVMLGLRLYPFSH